MIEPRTYVPDQVIAFRKTDGPFGGLSNMAPGFPLSVAGTSIRTSEALYQACRFPHRPQIQRMIVAETSPMTAKMRSKPFRADSRPDWDTVRVPIMRWCLRVKLAQNLSTFGDLLRRTGGREIVEDSRKDDFWGAKATPDGLLHGCNVLGRLLMELRDRLAHDPTGARVVLPAPIKRFELFGTPIGRIEANEDRVWYDTVPEQNEQRPIYATQSR